MSLAGCAGLPWAYCSITDVSDPGGGKFRFNAPTAEATTRIAISDACFDRRNPDVSRYVGSWDKSTNINHRGTLIITRDAEGPEALAIFEICDSSTDHEGWTELAVRPVQSSLERFNNREKCSLQFYRTGDSAGSAYTYSVASTVQTSDGVNKAIISIAERSDMQEQRIAKLEAALAALASAAA